MALRIVLEGDALLSKSSPGGTGACGNMLYLGNDCLRCGSRIYSQGLGSSTDLSEVGMVTPSLETHKGGAQ